MDTSGSLHGWINGVRKLKQHHFRLAGKAQWYDFNFNAIALHGKAHFMGSLCYSLKILAVFMILYE